MVDAISLTMLLAGFTAVALNVFVRDLRYWVLSALLTAVFTSVLLDSQKVFALVLMISFLVASLTVKMRVR